MSYYTPCDQSEAAANYFAVGSCNSRCQSACKKASECTTAVVQHLCSRVCDSGFVGSDSRGCCKPAFGDLQQSCDAFTSNCTSCSDSDACQAACAKVRAQSTCQVDESSKFPDKCLSVDNPEGVKSCTTCTTDACATWCDNYFAPQPHCVGDQAKSVQDSFIDQSLVVRDSKDLAAMGTFYDAKCKAKNMQDRQVVLDLQRQAQERSPYFGVSRGEALELARLDPFNKRLRDRSLPVSTWATVTESVIASRRQALENAKKRQIERQRAYQQQQQLQQQQAAKTAKAAQAGQATQTARQTKELSQTSQGVSVQPKPLKPLLRAPLTSKFKKLTNITAA